MARKNPLLSLYDPLWPPPLPTLFDDVLGIWSDFDAVFDMGFRGYPKADMIETGTAITVEFEIPNIDPKQISVRVERQTLSVSGEVEKEKTDENKRFLRQEIRRCSFRRSILLPTPVMADKTSASYENGMLTVVMPKQEVSESSAQIPVEIKDK